jgi:hypothetical protein
MQKQFKIKTSSKYYNFGDQEISNTNFDYIYTSLQVDTTFTCDDIEIGVLSYQNGASVISYNSPENDFWQVYKDASSDLMIELNTTDENTKCFQSITNQELDEIFDAIKSYSIQLASYIENKENLKVFLQNLRKSIIESYPNFCNIDLDSAYNVII